MCAKINEKHVTMMKKKIILAATAVAIALVSLTAVSCTEEFEVEKSQLCGTWYFPMSLPADTVTGFNWAGMGMTINNNDTLFVNGEPSKLYRWILRDNSVTATCTPRANVDEHYVIAFTVYDISATKMEIKGKYRYLYEGENSVRGDITCTMTKNSPSAK